MESEDAASNRHAHCDRGDRAYAAQEMEHEAFVPVADFGGAGWGLR
jgi:hypothetical protein